MAISGSHNIVSAQTGGAPLADLTDLLAQIPVLLPDAGLDAESAEAAMGDLDIAHKQVAKEKPNTQCLTTLEQPERSPAVLSGIRRCVPDGVEGWPGVVEGAAFAQR